MGKLIALKIGSMLSIALVFCAALPAVAQTAQAVSTTQSGPAWSPSKDIGVFVFGRGGQNADQQLKDESECYGAAKQQSGVDPKAPLAPTKTEEQKKAEQQAAAGRAGLPGSEQGGGPSRRPGG